MFVEFRIDLELCVLLYQLKLNKYLASRWINVQIICYFITFVIRGEYKNSPQFSVLLVESSPNVFIELKIHFVVESTSEKNNNCLDAKINKSDDEHTDTGKTITLTLIFLRIWFWILNSYLLHQVNRKNIFFRFCFLSSKK